MKDQNKVGMALGVGAGFLFFLIRALSGSIALALAVCVVLLAGGLGALLRRGQQAPAGQQPAAGEPEAPLPDDGLDLPAAHACLGRIFDLIHSVEQPAVNREALECAELCREILQTADEKPQVRKNLTNFCRHYLPMFEQMMANYVKCASAAVLPDSLMKEIMEFLDVMEAAMKNLKENLYASDVMRLSVDMDVLQSLYRTDGLLDGGLAAEAAPAEKD